MRKNFLTWGLALILGFLSSAKGEELNIYNYALTTNNIHSRYIYNSHNTNSTEGIDTNDDILDYPYINGQWLGGYTLSGTSKLRRDSRPFESERVFTNYLTAFDQTGLGISCSNRLHFSIDNDTSNRTFTAKIKYPDEQQFIDIREIIANHQGHFFLRNLVNATNNQVYCTFEVSSRFLTNPAITSISPSSSTNISLEVSLQPGTYSQVESTTNFQDWTNTSSEAYTPVSSNNFNASSANNNYKEKTALQIPKKDKDFLRIRTRLEK